MNNNLAQKKKLAILINSLAGGGAERVVSILLNALKNDFDTYLVLLDGSGIAYPLPEGQKLHVLKNASSRKGILNIAMIPLNAWRYRNFCRRNNIEVTLSFLNRSNYINCLSRKFGAKGKVIISERAYTSEAYEKGLMQSTANFLIAKLYPLADLIIPISKGVEKDLRQNHQIENRYRTIYNPIDSERFHRESIEKKTKAPRPFTFINVGRLEVQKNHHLLIEAFSTLKDLDCRLQILGEGPFRPSLEALIAELGLEGKVELPGFQKDAISFYANADCKVFSSDFEGLGNVLLEALACSLPIVSTDCFAGPREILAPGTDHQVQLQNEIELADFGILTPIRNASLLGQAMRMIYEDASLREKYAAKAYSRARGFDVSIIAENFKNAINDPY